MRADLLFFPLSLVCCFCLFSIFAFKVHTFFFFFFRLCRRKKIIMWSAARRRHRFQSQTCNATFCFCLEEIMNSVNSTIEITWICYGKQKKLLQKIHRSVVSLNSDNCPDIYREWERESYKMYMRADTKWTFVLPSTLSRLPFSRRIKFISKISISSNKTKDKQTYTTKFIF